MGFLNPASLLFGLSLAVLVAIYLRSRSRPTLNVSSIMLFEEVPAPVAKSRVLRLDLLFWLEALALSALTLAVAGFYVLGKEPVGRHQLHALIFDLGAGMSAVEGDGPRLEKARAQARQLVSTAPAGDTFTIIGYALEARTLLASTNRKDHVLGALQKLEPMAVAARAAALRAALLDARGASRIDIFADRALSKDVIRQAQPDGWVEIHQVGGTADNIAITSLDAGVPRSSPGHCVLRNFSNRPADCELAIDINGKSAFQSPLILEPRAQAIVTFPPPNEGGVVRARLITPDALAADNQRYAVVPSVAKAQALVLSPDADVRDDLARVVLAINPGFLVTALDPAQFQASKAFGQRFDLALLHDCSDVGVKSSARMFIFPEPRLQNSRKPQLVRVIGSVALAELQSREDTGALATPALLGPSRVVELPGWMDALGHAAQVGGHDSFPVDAVGQNLGGEVGVITFDIRNHLLLDPDRMDALVLTIDTLKRMVAPENVKVVVTGSFVAIPVFARAVLAQPDGSRIVLEPDQWGRVRFRPLQAGRYRVSSQYRTIEVFANYYDAAESDLSVSAVSSPHARPSPPIAPARSEVYPRPVVSPMIALAMLLLLAESALLARRAIRWGVRHV